MSQWLKPINNVYTLLIIIILCTCLVDHLDFHLFRNSIIIGVRKSTFLLAENDGGIHLTVKLTKNFLERFICYINDYILKNNF